MIETMFKMKFLVKIPYLNFVLDFHFFFFIKAFYMDHIQYPSRILFQIIVIHGLLFGGAQRMLLLLKKKLLMLLLLKILFSFFLKISAEGRLPLQMTWI